MMRRLLIMKNKFKLNSSVIDLKRQKVNMVATSLRLNVQERAWNRMVNMPRNLKILMSEKKISMQGLTNRIIQINWLSSNEASKLNNCLRIIIKRLTRTSWRLRELTWKWTIKIIMGDIPLTILGHSLIKTKAIHLEWTIKHQLETML